MNQNLTVITTCTNRKNIISEVGCQLREYAGEDYLDTLDWIRSLSESHPVLAVNFTGDLTGMHLCVAWKMLSKQVPTRIIGFYLLDGAF